MKGRETRTIAAIAFDCRSSITNLLVAATSEECCVKDFLNSRDVQQMRDRFNQWAANLGALQPFGSPLSLDHRLRDAPRVEESILYTLADLHSSIQAGKTPSLMPFHGLCCKATDIALGRRPNRVITHPVAGSDVDLLEYGLSASDSDSSSVSSSDGETAPHNTSEIQELLSATRIGIDSLFKASIFVRKNASKDRRLRAATKDIFDNRADILHISDRYPLLKHNSTLVPRLGEANARRRQYFTYLRDHNERLAAVSDDSDNIEAQIHPGVVRAEAAMTVMTGETKPSLLADTAATPFVADEAAQDRILGIFAAPKAKSVVSFATSVAETSDKDLQFPPVPAEAKDPSFKCPYCGLPMELKDGPLKEDQWRCEK